MHTMDRVYSWCCVGLMVFLGGREVVLAQDAAKLGAAEDAARRAQVEEWRQARHQRLLSSDGWLTLTGLFWLEEGENVCGSAAESDVVLPASVPSKVGVLRLADGAVELVVEPGVEVSIDGTRSQRVILSSDAAAAGATVVAIGSARFYLIERQGRVAVRIKDSASEALREFRGMENFPIDMQWWVEADFEPYDPPKAVKIPSVLGAPSEQLSPGAVVFRMAGRSHRIDALPAADGELFIVFGDATNGKETYGGGRFLYGLGPDQAGLVLLDFNRAYNPPCVFTPYATCPLPPPQNKLQLAVRAGEKQYAGSGAH